MTDKKKPRGKSFEKGNEISKLGGRPRTSEEEKLLKKLTRTEFQNIVHMFLGKKQEDLTMVLTSSESTVLETMVVSVMAKALRDGDEKKLNWFLEQIFGKMKETSSVEMKIQGDINMTQGIDLSNLTDEELADLEKIFVKATPGMMN